MKTKQTFLKGVLIALILCKQPIQAQFIAAGGWHSLALCTDSSVKAFGENASGQLGDGSTSDKSSPVSVNGLSGIIAVSAGGDQLEAHSVALKANGTVWGWGSNLYGGLGNGSTTNSGAPVQAQGLSNVTHIAAGGWHTMALKSDGTVWTWGWNADGQLGLGNTTDKSTPQQVPGLNNITRIAAGTYHNLALRSDGTVWAWGDNISGQIGDGSTTDRSSPVQVTGLSNVIAISAGRFFSLAIKQDGSVWTWGENLYGQLGDGTTVDKSSPVQVSGLTGITGSVVATGAFHCLVVKSDNTVWSWGRNTYGNLGDGSVTNRSTPVQVSGMNYVAGMAAGTNFSLFHKSDGSFWACGRNASGQLGDGTVTQRNTVTQGTSVCSVKQAVGLIESSLISSFNIFPNPSSSGLFSVESEKPGSLISLRILSLQGEVLWWMTEELETVEQFRIDLSSIPSGMYLLEMETNQGRVVKKIIKG